MTERLAVQIPEDMSVSEPAEGDDEREIVHIVRDRWNEHTVTLRPFEVEEDIQMQYIRGIWHSLPENDGGDPRWVERLCGARHPGCWTAELRWDEVELPWRATKEEALQDALNELHRVWNWREDLDEFPY